MTPAPSTVTQLTNRLLKNPRVRYYWAPAPGYELSSWIVDELLVSKDVDPAVRKELGKAGWKKATSVLAPGPGMPKAKPHVVDVEIWKPSNKSYVAVEALLAHLASIFPEPPKVSPNHLLVPCVNRGCYCPGGPPKPVAFPADCDEDIREYSAPKYPTKVAVIDTGYIRHPALDARTGKGGFVAVQGDVLNRAGTWVKSKRDGLYRSNGRLQLLDGHGTFTAGVIAERCPHAQITLVGIRAIESAATEAAVLRAVCRHADADVIMPVFAFHSLLQMKNWTFPNILRQLAPESVLVCPAGNESSPAPHYPAALPWPDYPVIGVGSFVPLGRTGVPNLSEFSNYGSWVRVYTGGEEVVGPYLSVAGVRVEDGDGKRQTFNGWAEWYGTSFATPKVAAAILNRKAGGGARDAANALMALGSPELLGSAAAAGLSGLDLRLHAQ